MQHPTERIIHTTAFVTPVMEHWLEREKTKNKQIQGANVWSSVFVYQRIVKLI